MIFVFAAKCISHTPSVIEKHQIAIEGEKTDSKRFQANDE